ncbi:MAG: hypothetical protein LIP00_11925 [Parabacteroides sp.]|nr:hypothetical protein [Parabacteroides sp.]
MKKVTFLLVIFVFCCTFRVSAGFLVGAFRNTPYPFTYSYEDSWHSCAMDSLTEVGDWETNRLYCKLYVTAQRQAPANIKLMLYESRETNNKAVRLCSLANAAGERKTDTSLTIKLSDGTVLRTSDAWLYDARKDNFKQMTSLGIVQITTNCLSLGKNAGLSSASDYQQHAYAATKLATYNIESITVEGYTFNFEGFRSAATFRGMFERLAEKTGDAELFNYIAPSASTHTDDWENYSSSAPEKSAAAEVSRITTEHNVYGNGAKGMYVTFSFDVSGMKGKTGEAIAYFYFENGTKLKDYNRNYYTTSGNVCASTTYSPRYDESTYTDLRIFIPYNELHLAAGRHDLKAYVAIFDDAGNQIGESDWVSFWWSSTGR